MVLRSRLLDFAAGLPQVVDEGARQTAEEVKATRDPLTPVDTGELLASGVVVQIAPGHWQFQEGGGLPDARSVWTEFGTDKAPAQPHVTPAAEQNRDNLSKNITAQLKELEGRCRL